MSKWYDLSHDFHPGMPVPDWPGEKHQEFCVESFRVDSTGGFQDFVTFNAHCGTHMDAPGHYAEGRRSVDLIPLSECMGACFTIDVPQPPLTEVTVDSVAPFEREIRDSDMLFLRTGWEDWWSNEDYEWRYPYLSPEVGEYLQELSIKVLGLDTPGPDSSLRSGLRNGSPLHVTLLSNDVFIIENLTNLKSVAGRRTYVYAVPLKFRGCFGAPARVIAKDF